MENSTSIIGCCNEDRVRALGSRLSPHDLGGYLVDLLDLFNSKYRLLKSPFGINNTLIELPLNPNDIVFIDDIYLEIGKYKIMQLRSYGNRGHNAIRTLFKESYRRELGDITLILIGAKQEQVLHPKDICLMVNRDYNELEDGRARLACLSLARGFYSLWPNGSHVIQVARGFYTCVLKALKRS